LKKEWQVSFSYKKDGERKVDVKYHASLSSSQKKKMRKLIFLIFHIFWQVH